MWIVDDVLPRYGLTLEDIVLGTPDNASSVTKSLRLAGIECRGCCGHGIQTCMQNALGTIKVKHEWNNPNPEAKALINKNKLMVTKVHYSTKNNKYLAASQTRRGVAAKNQLHPRQDVATRFNSTGLTVERNNILEHDLTATYNEDMQKDYDKVSS